MKAEGVMGGTQWLADRWVQRANCDLLPTYELCRKSAEFAERCATHAGTGDTDEMLAFAGSAVAGLYLAAAQCGVNLDVLIQRALSNTEVPKVFNGGASS